MQNQLRILTADEEAYIESHKNLRLAHDHDFQNDPLFKAWIKQLTKNILDGVFPRDVRKENVEAIEFLRDHKTERLKDTGDALLLFKPKDPTLFTRKLREIWGDVAPDKVETQEDPGKTYCNYFVKHITKIESIFNQIDEIKTKEHIPYKIAFDCGFIIEDSKEGTYSASEASQDNLGRTIPMVIRGPGDVKLFKHLVFTTLGNYTSEIHTRGGSRFHYVAIHSIMFQVTRLKGTGARFLVPGYDFLIKNRYIRDYGNEHNLCMFYVVANTKK